MLHRAIHELRGGASAFELLAEKPCGCLYQLGLDLRAENVARTLAVSLGDRRHTADDVALAYDGHGAADIVVFAVGDDGQPLTALAPHIQRSALDDGLELVGQRLVDVLLARHARAGDDGIAVADDDRKRACFVQRLGVLPRKRRQLADGRVLLEYDFTFTVGVNFERVAATGNENYTAVYNSNPRGKVTVIFESGYSQVMARTQVTETGALGLTMPRIPQKYGFTCSGWELDQSAIAARVKAALESADKTDDVITIKPAYTPIETVCTVKVTGGSGSGDYHVNDNVTLVANAPEAGKKFSHWVDGEGNILSYNEKFAFIIFSDLEAVAVYVGINENVDAKGIALTVGVESDDDGAYTFITWLTVPEGCTMKKAGAIISIDPAIGLDPAKFTDENAAIVAGDATSATSYRYTATVKTSKVCYARAYLVYSDAEGNVHTVYGDIIANR